MEAMAGSGEAVVRTAGPDDLTGVLDVHRHRDPGTDAPAEPNPRQRRTWAEMMAREGLTVYVADLDGAAIGTATLLVMPTITQGCEPTAFVEAVVVDHRHRRRGVATAILRRALDDARALGCNKVQLLSHKRHRDDGAHALYVSLGFGADAEGFRLYLIGGPTRPEPA